MSYSIKNIRKARLDDLEAIVRIYNSTIASRMVTADLDPIRVDEKIAWWKAHEGREQRPVWVLPGEHGEVVAWMSVSDFYGRPAYSGCAELSIYIDPEERGKGLGKLLLQFLMDQARSLELHSVLGFIFEHNAPSVALFESCGFDVWGRLPEVAVLDDLKATLLIMGRKV